MKSILPSLTWVVRYWITRFTTNLRVSHKLSRTIFDTLSIHRTFFRLAVNVFHESTVCDLFYHVHFVQFVQHLEWLQQHYFFNKSWICGKMLNVKSKNFSSWHKNDELCLPASSRNDFRWHSLKEYHSLFRNDTIYFFSKFLSYVN